MATEVPQPRAEYTEYSSAARAIVMVALMLGVVLEILDVSIVNVAIPDMMGNLGATLDEINWVATGYIVANVIVLPLTGWLASRLGRRRYLAGSIILFTGASILCGLSTSLTQLILFRIMQGAGGAALLSTAQATLFEIFPPNQISMVQAIFGIGVMVGPTVGPTLGGWITDNYTWRWVFFINVPTGIAAAIMTLIFLKESRYRVVPRGKIDFIGIGFLALGIGSMQIVLDRGNREDWFQSDFIAWFTFFAVVGLIAFVIWELRVDEPAVNLRILKYRDFAAGCVYGIVLGFGLYGVIFILPVFLQSLLGYSATETGWIVFPGGLATALTLPITGKLGNIMPPRQMVAIGTVGFVVSMWMLHNISMQTGPGDLFWPLVLRGAAMGFLFLPLTLATLISLVGKDIGAGTGLFNLFRQLGGSMGIAFLSTFLDHRSNVHRSVLVEQINVYNPIAMQRMHDLQQMFVSKGASATVARQQALALIDRTVQGQATVLAYSDAFLLVAIVFACALPLLFFFKKGKVTDGPGGAGTH